jgi:peptidase E
MADRQIVAIGGGGISQDPDNPRLLDFLVRLTGRDQPKVCLIQTASGDREAGLVNGYQAFSRRGCQITHLAFFPRIIEDMRGLILNQDLIYVGGGSTANLLAIWRLHGLDAILREAWEAGIVLAGVSAGAICWFEAGTTDSFGPTLQPMRDGLGFLPGSCCPHYNGEAQRRPLYHRVVAEGFPAGYAVDDGCALHYRDTALAEVVTSLSTSRAFRVGPGEDGAIETPLEARLLGS